MLASGSWDRTARLWNVRTGISLHILREKWGDVDSVAFSPDGRGLASGGGGRACLWDVRTGELQETLAGHLGSVSTVAFSPDGFMLASGSSDRTIRLWDVLTGELLQTLAGHTAAIPSVAFSPDGQTLASCGGGTVTGFVCGTFPPANTCRRLKGMQR